MEWLYRRGVSKIVVGYPKYIAQERDKGSKINFEVVHVWRYGYLPRRMKEAAKEYGMEVGYVDENNTSKTCPICRVVRNHKRITRGLFKCRRHNYSV